MNEFSKKSLVRRRKLYGKELRSIKSSPFYIGILSEKGRSELNFSVMGKVAKTGNTNLCTYRRLEFTERHLESCSNEPAAMKQVMVPDVREHSIPIHKKNGPSFSFITAKWLFRRRRAFNIKIQITDSVTWKGPRSHYKSTQCSAWVMLTKDNFGSSILK